MSYATPMKHIFDSSFRYRPSFDTDIRSTFERIRRQQAQRSEQAGAVNVVHLDQSRKAGSS